MKRSTALYTLFIGLLSISLLTGCSSTSDPALKEELKAYKKMSPEQIRQMKMNYEAKLSNTNKIKDELRKSESREDSVQRLYNASAAKLKLASKEVESAKQEAELAKMGIEKGIVFKVQIGAFKKLNLSNVNTGDGMSMMEEDGLAKYFIGSFNSFDEATAFAKEIKKIGLSGAFVVAFEDGQKIDLETAKKGASMAAPAEDAGDPMEAEGGE